MERIMEDIQEVIDGAFKESDFAQLTARVDFLFESIGAQVIYEIPYADTGRVALSIPAERSESVKGFIDRPA
jgi:hypothetical protein